MSNEGFFSTGFPLVAIWKQSCFRNHDPEEDARERVTIGADGRLASFKPNTFDPRQHYPGEPVSAGSSSLAAVYRAGDFRAKICAAVCSADNEVTTKRGLAPIVQVLRFGDDPPRKTPAILSRIEELPEHSGGRLGLRLVLLGLRHLGSDLFFRARILRQSEEVVDARTLAPGHQFPRQKPG